MLHMNIQILVIKGKPNLYFQKTRSGNAPMIKTNKSKSEKIEKNTNSPVYSNYGIIFYCIITKIIDHSCWNICKTQPPVMDYRIYIIINLNRAVILHHNNLLSFYW